VSVLGVLLGHVPELPRQRQELEHDQDPEQHDEEEPERGDRAILGDDHPSIIAGNLSIVNR
jgi:hypothetical protein